MMIAMGRGESEAQASGRTLFYGRRAQTGLGSGPAARARIRALTERARRGNWSAAGEALAAGESAFARALAFELSAVAIESVYPELDPAALSGERQQIASSLLAIAADPELDFAAEAAEAVTTHAEELLLAGTESALSARYLEAVKQASNAGDDLLAAELARLARDAGNGTLAEDLEVFLAAPAVAQRAEALAPSTPAAELEPELTAMARYLVELAHTEAQNSPTLSVRQACQALAREPKLLLANPYLATTRLGPLAGSVARKLGSSASDLYTSWHEVATVLEHRREQGGTLGAPAGVLVAALVEHGFENARIGGDQPEAMLRSLLIAVGLESYGNPQIVASSGSGSRRIHLLAAPGDRTPVCGSRAERWHVKSHGEFAEPLRPAKPCQRCQQIAARSPELRKQATEKRDYRVSSELDRKLAHELIVERITRLLRADELVTDENLRTAFSEGYAEARKQTAIRRLRAGDLAALRRRAASIAHIETRQDMKPAAELLELEELEHCLDQLRPSGSDTGQWRSLVSELLASKQARALEAAAARTGRR